MRASHAGAAVMNLASFQEHFSTIAEPRQSAKVSYPLFDILFLTVAAVIT